MIEAVKSYVYNRDLLRKSVTVPVKALVIAAVAVAVVMLGVLVAGRVQRHYGPEVATTTDIAALRQSVDSLRSVCAPKPVSKK